jgi:hypothetical protein
MREKVGNNFQIVFVSRDKTEEEFGEYFATMPWLAMPYDAEKAVSIICMRHAVSHWQLI